MAAEHETWIPFVYRGFYDVPLVVVTVWQGRLVVLDRDFVESLDEYSGDYEVFIGEARSLDEAWDTLIDRARLRRVGSLAVATLEIDRKQRLLKASCLGGWEG
ncbi:MAG: hypothetical protein IPL61_20180 [Myxococcales bacterium]|nr:hypothetical protein [Myxococcales bacterium]